MFIACIVLHFLFVQIIHPIVFVRESLCDKGVGSNSCPRTREILYPFLPLLLYSCMGALQLLVVWVQMFVLIWKD